MSKSTCRWIWCIGLVCLSVQSAGAQPPTFDIYWVDVEGGAATLLVSPTGESLLVDTGFPDGDRDATRIAAAAREAGLTRIDHLVITHYHRDHVGGLEALAGMIPIERCLDHGTNTEESNQQWVDAYLRVCGDKRVVVEAGERIAFGPVEIDIITSDGRPQRRGTDPLSAAPPSTGGGTGTRCGRELSCPVNRSRSRPRAGAPRSVREPPVIVVNNGTQGSGRHLSEVSTAHTG